MNQLIASDPTSKRADQVWLIVAMCICVLMAVTISAPEDFKIDSFGTASVLPPNVIKLSKLIGRGMSIVLLAYSLYLVWHNPRRRHSLRLLMPVIAFALFGIVSTLWSASQTTTLNQTASFAIPIGLAVVIATVWRNENDTSRLLQYCSIVLFFISVVLIVLHFAQPRLGVLTRSSSGLFHSTNAGASASLGILILLTSWVIWRWSWTIWLLIPASIVHLTAMTIGGNRMSVAVMVVLCLILFVTMTHKVVLAAISMTAVAVSFVYLCLDPGLTLFDSVMEEVSRASAQGQTSAQIGSLSGRAEMWQKIWTSFQESPWIGHGYFVTSKTGRLYVWGEYGNWTAHNAYLQLLVTTGVVGGLLFVTGLLNIGLRVVGKLGGRDKASHRHACFVLVFAAWFVGWGFLNESVFGPLQPESVVFGVILGLATALIIPTQTEGGDQQRGHQPVSMIGVAR